MSLVRNEAPPCRTAALLCLALLAGRPAPALDPGKALTQYAHDRYRPRI